MQIEILPASEENAEQIIAALRPADIQTLGVDGAGQLRQSLARSFFAWVAYADGELACVWGLEAPAMLSSRAYMWLALTPVAEAHAFTLTRRSQMVVQALAKEFEVLEAVVEINNFKAKKWLRWLGFRPGDACVVNGRQMRRMELRMDVYDVKNHTEVA